MRAVLLTALLVSACSADPPCRIAYGRCEADGDCGAGTTCERIEWEFGAGDACVRSCVDEVDCEREGGRTPRCLDVGRRGTFRCYAGCVTDEHCPAGWVCQPVSTGGAVCLP